MKTLLRFALFIVIYYPLAFGQAKQVPICNGLDASGNPINTTTNSPNCTDYFGSGNWANSPLPAGTITGYTLISGGSGYSAATTVQVTDITGAPLTGASAPTPIVTGGAITGFTGGTGGVGYTAPVVMIMDTTGSGAMATAIIGPPFTGGMKKFMDPLVDLKTEIATPDPNVFPGSDYYEIALVQYTQSLSPSNLPATTLRGYVQVPTGSAGCTAANAATPKYLGPVILAQKGRPVRVKFTNCLATGAGGDLFIPVDTTYMGAGMNMNGGGSYTENRATLHLHGGATPWISDGTPHQWTTPAGENQKGDSVAYVPDMWFDATGAIIPSCAGLATCATGSNNPGPGSLSFYWTNDQGARLMFYHDHAYGLTRLNVYAGEAAGYLLYDTAEEDALKAGTAPGTISSTGVDSQHLIPLVIQDKTFVPSKTQLDAQDPTWDGNFGALPLNTTTGNGNGDLWFPHIYMPNQNPNDPLGANGVGRWDYGAWFFPPQTSLTAAAAVGSTNGMTLSCTSKAFPNQTLASSSACPSCGCPITPNPSGTPESFMDTPVVNGVAYPVLHVTPAAYRFKILSAGNDRSWNLSWFVADSTQGNTEVAIVPAAPPSTGSAIPLCTAINPVAVPSLDLGLVTGLLDNAGNPLNGTGLPSGCWPNFGPQAGIPAPQTMWAADGRAGGSPDPRNAGPPWIQIGSEGGLLPAPVVIPATPVNYEQNVRSITIGSVAMHGLWLGPAERADVIVDFSQFAGKTLILYNDAPTPAPAVDSRLDYFTGDGDQTPIGGAPNTPPGYGPNTRTIMQVVVGGSNDNAVPFSLTTLKNAFASTATTQGVFAKTQPTTIVPEPAYNSAYGKSFSPVYSGIQNTTLTFTPISPLNFDSSCTATAPVQCDNMRAKTIQELFTLDYGRMNATLGTELPNVNFQNQTTIPLAYVDPATEIIRQGDTQLWKITHNGVDSHFIHFHLFNVQVINRVGWDGSIRPIDANEAGWKDTVRMNPLEDIIVALQPITPTTPFPVPNSVRLLDVTTAAGTTAPAGSFSDLNPFTNGGATTSNEFQNFGWEYVWHCHILGHEENDMMRPIIFQVPPLTPSNLAASRVGGVVNLAFTDNSANETGFVVQRSTDPSFLNPAPVSITVGPSSTVNSAGEGTDWGSTISLTDSSNVATTTYYRVQAVDDGWKGAMSQSYTEPVLGSSATCGLPTPAGTPVALGNCPLVSGWSNTVTVGPAANATAAPNPLIFANQLVNTSVSQTVTLSNAVGAGALVINAFSITGTNAGDFTQTNNCSTSLLGGASCGITVTFKPAAMGARTATLVITSSNPTPLSVTLNGTGIAPVITATPIPVTFGSVTVGTTSAPQTLTIKNTGTANLVLNSIGLSGGNATEFGLTNACAIGGAGLIPQANCTVTMTFKPGAMGNRSTTLIINSSDPATPVLNIGVSGFGTQSIAALSATSLTFPVQLVNTSSAAQLVTLSNTGNVAYTISGISLAGTNRADYVMSSTCPINPATLAAGGTCSISVSFRPTAGGTRAASVAISTTANVNPTPSVTLSGVGTQVNLSTLTLSFAPQVVGTQSAAQQVTLTNTGPAALHLNSITLAGTNPGDFSVTNNCPVGGNLGSGASCRVTLHFLPTAVGVRTATVAISTNDPGTPVANVAITGTGIQPVVSLTPASHNFGNVRAGTTSAPFAFTLTNSGTAILTINNISLSGGNANRFAETNNCGASLTVGASCTINVTFSPQKAGTAYSTTLRLTDNAPGSPQTAPLTGSGN
jgi:FtsP/CotA-like multicopper oxidase with cupredoxin domain